MSRMRIALPGNIASQMKLWRMGLIPIPQEYIRFHKDLANEDITYFENHGVKVIKKWVDSDGWMDGMRVIWLEVEYKDKTYKMSWDDGSQCFYEHYTSGGSSGTDFYRIFEKEDGEKAV